jgi:hypothetical protein
LKVTAPVEVPIPVGDQDGVHDSTEQERAEHVGGFGGSAWTQQRSGCRADADRAEQQTVVARVEGEMFGGQDDEQTPVAPADRAARNCPAASARSR